MVSTSYLIFMLSVFQCGIAFSKISTLATGNSPISPSELVEELSQESYLVRMLHFTYILAVESYGDHVYDMSKTLSAECSTTIKANSLLFGNLANSGSASDAAAGALAVVLLDMDSTKPVEEHPLELFCRSIDKIYAANETLSRVFEKAKIEVANFSSVSGRPPYYSKLLKNVSMDSLMFEIVDKFTVPELARLAAVASFLASSQFQVTNSTCRYYFAKACRALAKQENVADSMQNIFAKVVNETIPDIGVADRQEQRKATMDEGGYWWIPKMMRAMYSYIAQDPMLKTELRNMATSIGKDEGASEEDLDFSKI